MQAGLPTWTTCMQEAVAGTGIDKQKTLGDGGKGHRSSAPSVTPTPSRSKPTARPVLHKNGDDGLANPSETAETFDASRVRRHRLAQITPPSCFLRLPVAPTGAARRLFKGSRRLAGARHFWQVARVRDSESMQRAVWRKNSDIF